MSYKLLDTFCKAGGASMGYVRAGFEVVGVDIEPQPNYPFEFFQGGAIEFITKYGGGFDVITGSPPCQEYSVTRSLHNNEHPKLIIPTREAIKVHGKPYVLENVESPAVLQDMESPIRLCGSSFGIRVRRHRLFDSSVPLSALPCDHAWQNNSKIYTKRVSKARGFSRPSGTVEVHGGDQMLFDGRGDSVRELALVREVMGIDWMTKPELNQAIPPVYTEYIGKQLMEYLNGR